MSCITSREISLCYLLVCCGRTRGRKRIGFGVFTKVLQVRGTCFERGDAFNSGVCGRYPIGEVARWRSFGLEAYHSELYLLRVAQSHETWVLLAVTRGYRAKYMLVTLALGVNIPVAYEDKRAAAGSSRPSR